MRIDRIEFGILGNKEVRRMSVIKEAAGIIKPESYNNFEPVIGGLMDIRMGVIDPYLECGTCGLNSSECPGHPGHIELNEYVFHMGFVPFIKKILSCVCVRCSKLLVYKNESEIEIMLKTKTTKSRYAEIRNLCKSVTYCQKQNYGCGAPVPMIKTDTKKNIGIVLMAETISTVSSLNEATGQMTESKKKNKYVITPEACYHILKNISDIDCKIIGLDPDKSRPELMIIKTLPVPPIQVRPSARADYLASASFEDDLTHKLADIVNANARVKKNKEKNDDGKVNMYSIDTTNLLQYHVMTLFNNDSSSLIKSEQRNGHQLKSLSSRLKSKEGRIRFNLMGKRVDFSGRTVIGPDPNVSMDELVIPLKIAMNLTFPETVTPHNVDRLSELVKNGRSEYPGANFIFPFNKKFIIDLKYRKDVVLRYGDIVERHIVDGDWVLFNRQPSLHKVSMMAFRVRVLPHSNILTFKFNPAVCKPFNADFDGDEMNIHVPQSVQAQTELALIASVSRQIISPTKSDPLIGAIQDGRLGAYLITSDDVSVTWQQAMNLLAHTSIKDIGKKIEIGRTYTGKEMYSFIIPDRINVKMNTDAGFVNIENGQIIEGRMSKKTIGGSKNDIVHNIWCEYDIDTTMNFVNDSQTLIHNWLLGNGFTVSINDAYIDKDIIKEIQATKEGKKLEVRHMITELENNADSLTEEVFENSIIEELTAIGGNAYSLAYKNSNDDNSFYVTVTSGAKGTKLNTGQISCFVGQQVVEGKRIKKKINNRTLHHYHQNDDTSVARGFCERSYLQGLSPQEFYFHTTAGREGIIDTAIKSVTGDTPIIVSVNGVTKKVLIGDWIDNILDNKMNKDKVQHFEERDMELLPVEDMNMHIPTTDEDGKVSWGEIVNITRHDPGLELYKINTLGGRDVIVTESKSLLIWDEDKQKFLRKSTPEVVIGDFVPVTMNLPELECDNENTSIDIIQMVNKSENEIKEFISTYMTDHKNIIVKENCIDFNIDLVDVFSMMFARLGIYVDIKLDKLIISDEWLVKFTNMFDITFDNIDVQFNKKYKNDVVLDKIISIEKVGIEKYPKVYDLTIPSTLNFGLANGLHVVDTADSGYVSRKLIKALEDVMVQYDGTVRSSNDTIIQFQYGDLNIDPVQQKENKLDIINKDNDEIDKMYKMDGNNKYVSMMKNLRDELREIQMRAGLDYITVKDKYMLPFDLARIINNIKYNKENTNNNKEKLSSEYILNKIDKLLYEDMHILCMTNLERNNNKSIKYNDEKQSKKLLQIALHSYLAPKRCIEEYKWNKYKFDTVIDNILLEYNRARVQPGEMVGVVAAQSIGEPATQLTLNTFHSTGAARGGQLGGLPRFKELLNKSKNPKVPQTIVYFDENIKNDETLVHKIASYVKYTTLIDVSSKVDVFYDPFPLTNSFMHLDKSFNVFEILNPSKNTCNDEIEGMPWLFRIELDKEKMLQYDVTLLNIKSKFCSFWANRLVDHKGLKKEDRTLMDKLLGISISSNYDNSPVPVIHIRMDMDNFDFNTILSIYDVLLNKFTLKGIENITDSNLSLERAIEYDNNGKINQNEQYILYTSGVNVPALRNINGIDHYKTITTDIVQLYNYYGIEAARTALVNEFRNIIDGVNFQHLSILVDVMTNTGGITSIDRHGINKLDTDPLSRASFEKTVEQLIAAAVFGEVDTMRSVSSRIMVGRVIAGGTGLPEIMMDTNMLQNAEYVEEDSSKFIKTFNELSSNNLIKNTLDNEDYDVYIP
jgi:DNA-directed RNA polymerase beta' subunit